MTAAQEQVWTLVRAFHYLSAFDLFLSLPLVSKAWKQASDSVELWAFLLPRDFFGFDFEQSIEAEECRDRYKTLMRNVFNPDRLIRMQQGSLSTYLLSTGSVATEDSPHFASSARFCLTASGRLLITGGKQGEGRRCYVYYCEERRFEELARMRDYREYHGMCMWGGNVVVSGGYEMRSENSEAYISTSEQLSGSTWRPLSSMTQPRAYHTLVPSRQQIYAIAGMNSENGYLDSIECWENSVWRSLSVTLPEPISDPTAKAMGGDLLLIFGGMHEFGFLDSLFEIDLSTLTVSSYKLPVEIFTGNNCIARKDDEFILFNTLKEIVKLRYKRGLGVVG